VGEAHGKGKYMMVKAVKRRQRSSMEMLSPFHGFPDHVILIPRVDTRG